MQIDWAIESPCKKRSMKMGSWKKKNHFFLYCCCFCYFSPHFYGPILRPCLWWMIAKNQLDIYGFCGLWIHIGWNGFWINILSLGFCKTATQKSWAIPLLTNAGKKIKNEYFHSKKTWTHFIIGRYGSAENILIVDYSSFVATTGRKLYLLPSWIGC